MLDLGEDMDEVFSLVALNLDRMLILTMLFNLLDMALIALLAKISGLFETAGEIGEKLVTFVWNVIQMAVLSGATLTKHLEMAVDVKEDLLKLLSAALAVSGMTLATLLEAAWSNKTNNKAESISDSVFPEQCEHNASYVNSCFSIVIDSSCNWTTLQADVCREI